MSDFSFKPEHLSVNSGRVTFYLVNGGGAVHDMTISGVDDGYFAKSSVVSPGQTTILEVDLKPGAYDFYCSVTGHRDAGMKGSLSVRK